MNSAQLTCLYITWFWLLISFCLLCPFICYAVRFLELQSCSLVVFCCGHSGNLFFAMFPKPPPHQNSPILIAKSESWGSVVLPVHVILCINACQVLCILSLLGKQVLCWYTWCFNLCLCNRFLHIQKLANIVRSAGACGFCRHGFDMSMPLFWALCQVLAWQYFVCIAVSSLCLGAMDTFAIVVDESWLAYFWTTRIAMASTIFLPPNKCDVKATKVCLEERYTLWHMFYTIVLSTILTSAIIPCAATLLPGIQSTWSDICSR